MRFVVVLLVSLFSYGYPTSSAARAEGEVVLKFRESPQTSAPVVRLRELVEVMAGNSNSLDRILDLPLGPSPRSDQSQRWHQSDVLQHLQFRGINHASIRWKGAASVDITRAVQEEPDSTEFIQPLVVNPRLRQQAETILSQKLEEYLRIKADGDRHWEVKVEVPAEHVKTLQSRRNIVGVGGGKSPWIGRQEFVLRIRRGSQLEEIEVVAQVQRPEMVVVAARPLRRDELLTEEMLSYRPLPARSSPTARYYSDIAPLLGKQMRRSISTGLPLTGEVVGSPTVIQRGELLTVEAVSGGIVVSTTGKALQAGAVGEPIEVELTGRRKILATVIAPLVVRVAATSNRLNAAR